MIVKLIAHVESTIQTMLELETKKFIFDCTCSKMLYGKLSANHVRPLMHIGIIVSFLLMYSAECSSAFIKYHHLEHYNRRVIHKAGFDSPDLEMKPKRRKKNKYESYSKINFEKDPFEKLLEESTEKIRQINATRNHGATNNGGTTLDLFGPLSLQFPDNGKIDPNDPTTFGYTEIGRIIGAHGVHGMVKIYCTTDFPEQRLCSPGIRHLKPLKRRAPRQVVLLEGRRMIGDQYLVSGVWI